MRIRADSEADVKTLGELIIGLRGHKREAKMADVICSEHLMRFLPIDGEAEAAVVMLDKAIQYGLAEQFFQMLIDADREISREFMSEFFEDTAKHVLSGKDTEDAHSVGGWSQREIDIFMEAYLEEEK